MFNSHTNRRPKTGLTFKDTFLQTWPGAKCKKTAYASGCSAYFVSLADGTHVATAGNVAAAWERACERSDALLAERGLPVDAAPAGAGKKTSPVKSAEGLQFAF